MTIIEYLGIFLLGGLALIFWILGIAFAVILYKEIRSNYF